MKKKKSSNMTRKTKSTKMAKKKPMKKASMMSQMKSAKRASKKTVSRKSLGFGTRFSEAAKRQIRRDKKNGARAVALAKRHGVSRRTIERIVSA